jgi:hypothetical protein
MPQREATPAGRLRSIGVSVCEGAMARTKAE